AGWERSDRDRRACAAHLLDTHSRTNRLPFSPAGSENLTNCFAPSSSTTAGSPASGVHGPSSDSVHSRLYSRYRGEEESRVKMYSSVSPFFTSVPGNTPGSRGLERLAYSSRLIMPSWY